MDRTELLSACKGLLTTANKIIASQDRINQINNSYQATKSEHQLIALKTPKDAMGFVIIVAFAFTAIICVINSMFITAVALIASLVFFLVNKKKNKPLKTPFKIVLGVLAALSLYSLIFVFISKPIVAVALLIPAVIVSVIGVVIQNSRLKKENEAIAKKNSEIAVQNEQLSQECDLVIEEHNQYLNQLSTAAQGWYPPAYLSIDALRFFVYALENMRADDMKELVNLYEDECHKKKVENLLERQNLLSEIQIEQNKQIQMEIRQQAELTRSSIDRNTMAVNSNTVSNYAVANAANRVANSNESVADAIRRL